MPTLWQTITPWHALLWPLSVLFGLLVRLRRGAYGLGLLPVWRLPVPVVVVGNLSVGGTGKTPLVLWLVRQLTEQGYTPGVVSRGYGGSVRGDPLPVLADTDPLVCGDEPLLIARRAGCPVWVGRDRVAAGQALLEAHPEVDLLVSDDGLQHYRLGREVEIAVVEAQRRFGNGLLLPAGPLREPQSRLGRVDAVVVNGGGWLADQRQFAMHLKPAVFRQVCDPARVAPAEAFRGRRITALAGIGNPQRFFDTLAELGLFFVPRPLPDHHRFSAADLRLPEAEFVLMTEKDAVKCRQIADERCWALVVDAEVEPQLVWRVIHCLRTRNGPTTA